jgi:ABC-type transport system involved in cytochrome c biogenesis ATPase subunit
MHFEATTSRFHGSPQATPCIVLFRRDWDDHKYETLFHAYYVSVGTVAYRFLGRVKILQRGQRRPALPERFELLDESYCSVGQEVEYYERLHALDADQGREALTALRDLALAPEIQDAFASEGGFKESLFRFPNAEVARARARTLFNVPVKQDEKALDFTFTGRLEGFDDDHRVRFTFPCAKDELGRIMAIAGRNGTGKTQLVARLAQVLSGLGVERAELGTIEPEQRARVVVVSFNAFDRFKPPRDNVPGGDFSYYGLRTAAALSERRDQGGDVPARPGQIDVEYAFSRLARSLARIWTMGRTYQQSFRNLLAKVRFFDSEPHVEDLFAEECLDRDEMDRRFLDFTQRLQQASSGHQLLVFIVTAMVESVRERTVILLDEPETHLHPRLLSTLVRALYEMLVERDAYAIITTHSPIILQEIPSRSVRLLRVEGRYPIVKQYPGESFGEDLDVIVREAFGVTEEDRSYATILGRLAEDKKDRAQIEALFNGLSLGARMLLRDLLEREEEP